MVHIMTSPTLASLAIAKTYGPGVSGMTPVIAAAFQLG